MDQCKECGVGIVQLPKKRKKEFCSPSCRTNHWQKAKRSAGLPETGQIHFKKKNPANPPSDKPGAKKGLKSVIEYAPSKEAHDAPKMNVAGLDEVGQFTKPNPLTFADFKAIAAAGISADDLDRMMQDSKLSPGEKDLVRRKRAEPK